MLTSSKLHGQINRLFIILQQRWQTSLEHVQKFHAPFACNPLAAIGVHVGVNEYFMHTLNIILCVSKRIAYESAYAYFEYSIGFIVYDCIRKNSLCL